MGMKEDCIFELDIAHAFEDSQHRTRFKELLDCFGDKPFFNSGVCTCMYMSAFDDEHFMMLLATLNMMALGKDTDTMDMEANGEDMANFASPSETVLFQLSIAYVQGTTYEISEEEMAVLSERDRHVVQKTEAAGRIIRHILD